MEHQREIPDLWAFRNMREKSTSSIQRQLFAYLIRWKLLICATQSHFIWKCHQELHQQSCKQGFDTLRYVASSVLTVLFLPWVNKRGQKYWRLCLCKLSFDWVFMPPLSCKSHAHLLGQDLIDEWPFPFLSMPYADLAKKLDCLNAPSPSLMFGLSWHLSSFKYTVLPPSFFPAPQSSALYRP